MRFLLPSILTCTLLGTAAGQEWTRFRGPNGSGIGEAKVPNTWTDKDFLWKISLPGIGNSSPVVWGDKVFVTAGDNKTGKRIILCIAADSGKTLWQKEYDASTYKMHKRNTVATSTPAVDADRLYVAWGTPEKVTMMALDHNGQEKWKTDLGTFRGGHGFGTSPTRFEDLVILPLDQDGTGVLFALEAATGKVRWKVSRDFAAGGEKNSATYITPCIYQPQGKPAELIFTNWKHGITSIDPKDGKVNWEISVFNTKVNQERAIASPLIAGDLIIGTCGFTNDPKHCVAIRPPANKDDKPKEVWRLEKAVSYLPTPVVKGDRLYQCSEKGIASCLDVKTGKVIWQERVEGASPCRRCASVTASSSSVMTAP